METTKCDFCEEQAKETYEYEFMTGEKAKPIRFCQNHRLQAWNKFNLLYGSSGGIIILRII
jgi:hypothetical protein